VGRHHSSLWGIWGLDPVTAWPLLSAAKGHDLRPWCDSRPARSDRRGPSGRARSFLVQVRGGAALTRRGALTPPTAFYAARFRSSSRPVAWRPVWRLASWTSATLSAPTFPSCLPPFDPCDASCSNFATHLKDEPHATSDLEERIRRVMSDLREETTIPGQYCSPCPAIKDGGKPAHRR